MKEINTHLIWSSQNNASNVRWYSWLSEREMKLFKLQNAACLEKSLFNFLISSQWVIRGGISMCQRRAIKYQSRTEHAHKIRWDHTLWLLYKHSQITLNSQTLGWKVENMFSLSYKQTYLLTLTYTHTYDHNRHFEHMPYMSFWGPKTTMCAFPSALHR